MANNRSFIIWLHGLGDSGLANEPIKSLFTSPEFKNTTWSFPSAPSNSVTCKNGAVMPSWFDVRELPETANSPKDESGVLKAVQTVHAMIDKEIAAGTDPNDVFVCGFRQGGALTLASVLLYPKTLGGGAVFGGFVPFSSSIVEKISPNAKRTPILWSHGMADTTVLFVAGQAGPPFLAHVGVSCLSYLDHSISNVELRYLESWIKTQMKVGLFAKPITALAITLSSTIGFVLLSHSHQQLSSLKSKTHTHSMANNRSFIVWLHGLGDSGPANEPIKSLFTSPEFKNTTWSFPSAPSNSVTCNYGAVMPSWFDIHEIPVTANSPKDESGVLKAVQNVHAMIDKEIAAGTDPNNVFVCGFSQGGALTLASVLLYPKTLGGGAVFSGWVPFSSSIVEKISPNAKRLDKLVLLSL
ncbi:hypothetical protein ACJW31_05G164800 [Castanea mollissima]